MSIKDLVFNALSVKFIIGHNTLRLSKLSLSSTLEVLFSLWTDPITSMAKTIHPSVRSKSKNSQKIKLEKELLRLQKRNVLPQCTRPGENDHNGVFLCRLRHHPVKPTFRYISFNPIIYERKGVRFRL